jgi:hypothetical protein
MVKTRQASWPFQVPRISSEGSGQGCVTCDQQFPKDLLCPRRRPGCAPQPASSSNMTSLFASRRKFRRAGREPESAASAADDEEGTPPNYLLIAYLTLTLLSVGLQKLTASCRLRPSRPKAKHKLSKTKVEITSFFQSKRGRSYPKRHPI